ncbi:MAG: YkgJ family cysteine cluster protein [Chitinivibrionales bacterium]|nr:YkgJ family cysteine cluster protein [Chitinivibrionales bacterium]
MHNFPHRPYFFDEGLRFSCCGCGSCCTGDPGAVYLSNEEAACIAFALELALDEFYKCYTRNLHGKCSLQERHDGSCIFYDNGCTIYPVRPGQCRTYPFWFSILRSPERWRRESRYCPGIGRGKLHAKEEILSLLQGNDTSRT